MAASKEVILKIQKKRTTYGGRSGRGLSFKFTYNSKFVVPEKGPKLLVNLASRLSEANMESSEIISFVKAKFGGDVFIRRDERDGSRNIEETTGFVVYKWKVWTAKIECTETKSNGTSIWDNDQWDYTYSIKLTECKLPDTGKPAKVLKEEYETKDGKFVWNRETKSWIFTKAPKA